MVGADSVKKLREMTGAGIMDCKAALKENNGDFEKSVDWLRKKGVASAAKRAGREAKEGSIAVSIEGPKAVVVEVNCETDFVAKNDDFQGLVKLALQEVAAHGEAAVAGEKVAGKVAELSGTIGEKIQVRRAKLLQSKGGSFFSYVHSGKIGVVVELAVKNAASAKNQAFIDLGKDLAMQITNSNPIGITRAEVPAALIEREKAIYREEVKGKPENIVEKIIDGKLNAFYKTQCLLEQPFIKDDKQTVTQLLAAAGKNLGDTVEIKQFVRFQLGETIAS